MATSDSLLLPISLNKNAQFFHLSEHFKNYIADSVSQAFIGYLNNYLCNVIADDSIALRKVNSSDICQKYSECLSSCKSISGTSNAVDFVDESACPSTVLDLLWQIVRIQIMDKINQNRFSEIIYLSQEGEDVNSFSLISPEDILLRWLNYHLQKAGSYRIATNFTTDLSDSEIYRVVINGLNPAVCKPMQRKEADHMKQASHAIKPTNIYDANENLNMIFVAQLFNASNSSPKNEDDDSDVGMTKIQELPVQSSPVQEKKHEPNWQAIAEELLAENAAKAAEIESLRQRIESLQQDLALKSQGNCYPAANASNKLLSQRYKYYAPKWSPQKMAQSRISTNLLNTGCARSDYEKDNAHSQPHIFRSARDLRVESDSRVFSFFFCDIDATNTLSDEHSTAESCESSNHKLKNDREEDESDSRDNVSTVTDLQMLDSELSHGIAGDDESREVYFAMKKADMLFLLREYNSRRLSLRSIDVITQHGDDDSSTYSDVVECEKDFLSGVELSSSSWRTEVANYAEKIVCSPVSFDCGSIDTDDYVYDAHGALTFNKQFVEEDDIQVYDWEFWEVEDRNRTYLSDTIIFHQAAETSTDEELFDINDKLLESPIDGSVCVFDDEAIDTYSIADSYSCREDDDDFDDHDNFVYDGDDDDGLTGRYPDCEEFKEFGCGGEAFISVDDLAPTYDSPLSSSTALIDLPTTEDIGCAKAADEAGNAPVITYIQSRYHIHHHWLLFSIAACFISVCCWVLFFPSVVNLTKQGGSQTSITDTAKNTTGMPIVPSTSLISLPAAVIVRNITVKVLFAPIASRSTGPAHTFIHQLLKLAIKIFCGMPEEHVHLLELH